MTSSQLQIGRWDATGTAGTTRTVEFTFLDEDSAPVSPSSVSVWLGGTTADQTDLTGATETVGSLASNVATVDLEIPERSTRLRLELDGEVVTTGQLSSVRSGSTTTTDAVAIRVSEALTMSVTLIGGSGSSGWTVISGGSPDSTYSLTYSGGTP